MEPMLMDIAEEFCTERLRIRVPLPGDGKAVFGAIQASINELKPWLPFAQEKQSEEKVELNLRRARAKFLVREDIRLLLFLKDSRQFIGSSGLHNPDWKVPKFEIGYWIDMRYSGKGYMTEAVQGIADFAFRELDARRVEIRCDTLNLKSKAIPERLGFALEGTLRKEDVSVDEGRLRDTHIFAKVK